MLRTLPGRRLRSLVVAAGLLFAAWPAAALAAPTAVGPTPAPSPSSSSSACPDAGAELAAMSASRAWALAGSKGAGTVVSVIGTAAKAAETRCSVLALAPDAPVRVFPVSGADAKAAADMQSAASGGAVVVFADTAVDLTDPALARPLAEAENQGVVIIAATGDGLPAMPRRPAGVINVSAADLATHQLRAGSASGPTVTLAGYGADTASAAGYVAATAALVHTVHANWPVRQVAAQLAGSINPVSGSPHDDQLGYGVLQPVQALSAAQVDPATLPGFAALFPAGPAVPAPGGTAASGAPASQLAGAGDSTASPGAQGRQTPPVGSDQAQPSAPTVSGQAAAKSSSDSGTRRLLLVGLGALLAAGALVVWQRGRTPAPAPLKPPEELEPPTGRRHSGYSTPPE